MANLDEKDRALLDFARKLNATPGEMASADIEVLRDVGLSDRNIFDAVVIVAFFNFMNRIADGFGVVPEAWKQESFERHMREVLATREKTTANNPHSP